MTRIVSNDPNSLTLYAEALMGLPPWELYDQEGNPTEYTAGVVSALEIALAADPTHIGALHYYIHAMEPSLELEKALLATDTLGPLVPASGHLVHMPAHIYLRTGNFAEAVAGYRAIGV